MITNMTAQNSIQKNNIRTVRDSIGFSWNPSEMDNLISFLEKDNADNKQSDKNIVAAISPHDDYLYAGRVYYPLYKMIHAKEVVIFGVTHGTVRKEIGDPADVIILDDFQKWQATYKDMELSPLREKIKKELNPDFVLVDNKAHSLEHSIEAEIPFLQHYNKDVKITPIMVTRSSFEHLDSISIQLAAIIQKYIKENGLILGKDIFFLISNDCNHYGIDFNNSPYGIDETAHENAVNRDKEIANNHFNNKLTLKEISSLCEDLFPDTTGKKIIPLWCGRYPISLGLLTVEKVVKGISGKELSSRVLKYSDSWTEGVLPVKRQQMGLTAPFSLKHWVGYLSAAFYLE